MPRTPFAERQHVPAEQIGRVAGAPLQVAEHAAVEPEDRARALDVDSRPVQIGEGIPAVLYAADLMRLHRIKSSTFYARMKLGLYDRFEILPRIGRRRWDGAAVLKGLRARESTMTFGRKRLA